MNSGLFDEREDITGDDTETDAVRRGTHPNGDRRGVLTIAALEIAARGLPVFPCGRNKKPCISKMEGGRGFKDATTDLAEVERLFAHAGARLIGVPTGERSGFDVLDLDYRHGAGTWETANATRIPETRMHQSQSGGRHLLMIHAPGVCNSESRIAPGVDVRGEGGYVVFPPSKGYSVISDAEITHWPDWLLEIALPPPMPARPASANGAARPDIAAKRYARFVDVVLDRVRTAPDGQKHHVLRNAALSIGGMMDQAQFGEADATKQLLSALLASVRDWRAAEATIAWGLANGCARPIEFEGDQPPPLYNGNGTGNDSSPPPSTDEDPSYGASSSVIRILAGLRHRAADDGLAAMHAAGVPFYQRDRALVRVCLVQAKAAGGEIVHVPAVTPVTMPMLGRALGRSARWERVNKDGQVFRADPPKEVSEQILSMIDEWPFPPLYGVIGTPTLRRDGSLLAAEGYDPTMGLVLSAPPAMPTIANAPTKQDALDALATLNALLIEFPFANEASRSVAMSMLLTPVLRGALAPAVPMHVITAPEAGTGKSYLQDIASCIAVGDRCAVLSVAHDPNEADKRLIGAALIQQPIIALDNVSSLLFGDFLCQATERPLLQVRPLGTSNLVRIANTFTIFANGNNLTVGADVVRRTLQCALDANMEVPEAREFAADPVATVLADRGRYIAACLTVARAYIVAGRPGRLPPRPSYEGWSDTVRSALVWLNWPDPVDTVANIRVEDPIRQARAAVFSAWAKELQPEIGYQTKEVIKEAEFYAGTERANPALWDALFAIASPRTGYQTIDANTLGRWLRDNLDTISAGHKLTVDRSDAARPRWKLEREGAR